MSYNNWLKLRQTKLVSSLLYYQLGWMLKKSGILRSQIIIQHHQNLSKLAICLGLMWEIKIIQVSALPSQM